MVLLDRQINLSHSRGVRFLLNFSGAWETIRNQTESDQYVANNSVKRKSGIELWESTLISGPNWMQVNNYNQQRNALVTALYSESSEVTGIDLEGTDRILLFRETFIRLTDLTPGRRNTFLSGTFKYDGPYCFIALESDGFSNPDGTTILFPGGGVQMSYDWITGEPLGLF